MVNKFSIIAGAIIFFAATSNAQAAPLLLKEVLLSSNAHHPAIQEALAKQDEAAGNTQTARGAFDLRLDGDAKLRPSGYYDGNYAGARLVKPLAPLGAEIYGGYRQGRGDFPVYNEELLTKDAGEFNVGVLFSLLRNRDLDDRRFQLQDALFEQQRAQLDITLTRIGTQLKAMHIYGEWLAAGHMVEVYKGLLSLAQERQRNLKIQVKAGEASSIMATENEQNLLRRQAMLNEALRDFIKKSNDLSIFWRDTEGSPLVPDKADLPKSFVLNAIPPKDAITRDIARVLKTRPELQAVQLGLQQQDNRLRMGENALLPKVDIALELARDQGQGPSRLDGMEGIAMVKVSVPLQREYGLGQVSAAQARLRQIQNQQRLLQDSIQAELQNLAADLELTKANLDISNREVDLAERMQNAERKLLANGTSNLFLVNTREETAAEAKIKNILSHLYVFRTLGSYYAATIQFDKLFMVDGNQR